MTHILEFSFTVNVVLNSQQNPDVLLSSENNEVQQT